MVEHFLNMRIVDDIPNVLLYSRDICQSIHVANLFLARKFNVTLETIEKKEPKEQDIYCNQIKHSITYYSSPYHFEYPLLDAKQFDKHVFAKFIRTLVSSQCILNTKHVIKIIITSKLQQHTCQIIKGIQEHYSNDVLFVIVSSHLSNVDACLRNCCFQVNCNSLCTHRQFYYKPLVQVIQNMFDSFKDKTSIEVFCECHSLSFKLMNTFIPVHDVCKAIIQISILKNATVTQNTIQFACSIESKSKSVNKISFLYDSLLFHSYNLIYEKI